MKTDIEKINSTLEQLEKLLYIAHNNNTLDKWAALYTAAYIFKLRVMR